LTFYVSRSPYIIDFILSKGVLCSQNIYTSGADWIEKINFYRKTQYGYIGLRIKFNEFKPCGIVSHNSDDFFKTSDIYINLNNDLSLKDKFNIIIGYFKFRIIKILDSKYEKQINIKLSNKFIFNVERLLRNKVYLFYWL